MIKESVTWFSKTPQNIPMISSLAYFWQASCKLYPHSTFICSMANRLLRYVSRKSAILSRFSPSGFCEENTCSSYWNPLKYDHTLHKLIHVNSFCKGYNSYTSIWGTCVPYLTHPKKIVEILRKKGIFPITCSFLLLKRKAHKMRA